MVGSRSVSDVEKSLGKKRRGVLMVLEFNDACGVGGVRDDVWELSPDFADRDAEVELSVELLQ